jgi:hypothetical protein
MSAGIRPHVARVQISASFECARPFLGLAAPLWRNVHDVVDNGQKEVVVVVVGVAHAAWVVFLNIGLPMFPAMLKNTSTKARSSAGGSERALLVTGEPAMNCSAL